MAMIEYSKQKKALNIQTETPEEKEALDMVEKYTHKFTPAEAMPKDIAAIFDNDNAQFESLAVEVNSETVWDGEGLPPVGVDVMTSYTDTDLDGWCDFHGPSQVIAFADEHCWVAHHGKFHRVHKICNIAFKQTEPEETPEQKAAREREEEIADMSNRMGLTIQICEKIYDSGYRRMK